VSETDVAFLGIETDATGADLAVTKRLCTPFGFLYGGTGLAACAVAAEAVTGRPLKWITTQYVDNAFPGDDVRLDVEVVALGRATTQTHVRGRVGERTILHATTAHTDRPGGDTAWWGEPPPVSGPEEGEAFVMPFDRPYDGTFVELMERRIVPETDDLKASGRAAMWVRLPTWPIGSAASQGFVADIVPMALSLALGRENGATSLDNTMRVVVSEPTDEWILLDIEAEGFQHSIGHGRVRLWRRDGTLIGVGSQSAIVRTSHHARAEERAAAGDVS
jgi:acyl-CoA thioesterase-2